MLIKRIVTAIIGIPIITYIIWKGGYLFLFTVTVLTLIAVKEMSSMLKRKGIHVFQMIAYLFSIAIIMQAHFYKDSWITSLALIIFFLFSLIAIIQKTSLESFVFNIIILLYIPFLIRYIPLLRLEREGFLLVLCLLILTWTSDTAAFFVGNKLGRKKLIPKVSPNKTIEGAVGSIFFTTLLSTIILTLSFNILPVKSIIIGIILSVSAQVGDLFESFLKRGLGAKDSGDILPGHGGILDRIDSLLFTAPVFYMLSRYLLL